MDRLTDKLKRERLLILDGALATELERRGCDLNHRLWSARTVVEQPELIRDVHRAYLDAGCDVVISASYQASVPGFVDFGLSPADAREAYLASIRLALEARDEHVQHDPQRDPLVAVSIGPYGAYLADGSEYRGNYDVAPAELERFHRERIELALELIGPGQADLFAFETLPSLDEARILAKILRAHPDVTAWVSFSCQDGARTREGQDVTACAQALEDASQIVAVGVNCTDPRHLPELITHLGQGTTRPILAYPNSGESFDPRTKTWSGTSFFEDVERQAPAWVGAGARLLGGCCRTTPEDIAALVRWRRRQG